MDRLTNFENDGPLSDIHLSNVREWVRNNKETLQNMEGEFRTLIDERYWNIEENESGGADLHSQYRRYTYHIHYRPHLHGQVGGTFFALENRWN